jgi:intracellular multiplication protein IcmL
MAEEQNKNNAMGTDGLTVILMRNAFYRDNYKRALFAVLILFCVDVLLSFAIVHRSLTPPQPQYFATNPQYQLIKWHPLSDPVVSDNYVLQWVTTAVRQAFSLDFIHWREQLQTASINFTPSGWHWFLNAFKQSGDLQTLVQLKMVSDSVVTGAPVIQGKAILDGRFVWKVEMPMMITYTSQQKTIRQPLKIILMVQRVSVVDSPYRIAINQFLPEVQPQPGTGSQAT